MLTQNVLLVSKKLGLSKMVVNKLIKKFVSSYSCDCSCINLYYGTKVLLMS